MTTMQTVVGMFSSRDAAERATVALGATGIPVERINLLAPGAPVASVEEISATAPIAAGRTSTLTGVVGGALGAASGLALVSVIVPGVGLVSVGGLAAAALLGVGGAAAGAAAGGVLEGAGKLELVKEALFVYLDALRRGRSIVIAMLETADEAERARTTLAQAGSESMEAAHDRWWFGLRDLERETYAAAGGDFDRDEPSYRLGFEAALQFAARGKSYEEANAYAQQAGPAAYREASFRQGYDRGRLYYASWLTSRGHEMAKDPVCGMDVDPERAGARRTHAGRMRYFCSAACREQFDRDPARYLAAGAEHPRPSPR